MNTPANDPSPSAPIPGDGNSSGLAYIGQVAQIYPIPEADRIESLEVVCGPGGRWRGTAVKGQFAVGDLCEAYLQDALLAKSRAADRSFDNDEASCHHCPR
ncbi:MAG: hypothetical protein HZY76_00635 [Anaerolineae bacterium]|nr:MAG: hypothetical protein HZY76_00635 [Anaerolineae bacterium]